MNDFDIHHGGVIKDIDEIIMPPCRPATLICTGNITIFANYHYFGRVKWHTCIRPKEVILLMKDRYAGAAVKENQIEGKITRSLNTGPTYQVELTADSGMTFEREATFKVPGKI